MGVIASLVALYQSSQCFIGVLGDRLILVDPANLYRVVRTSRLQYRENHLIADDVIVFLGNRIQRLFDDEQLDTLVQPLVNRGIRTDRLTLQVKMLQSRHPQIVAQAWALLAAVLAALYLGVW